MKIKIQLISFIALLMGFLLTLNPQVSAQMESQDQLPPSQAPTPSDNEVNAIAKEMYCPVCENVPLDVCPTTACHEWRELIRLKISEGWSTQQIKEYFAAQYGDRVLAEPPRRGLNWLIYILPVIFFLMGLVVLANVLRPKSAKIITNASIIVDQNGAEDQLSDPYQAQIEEELRKK